MVWPPLLWLIWYNDCVVLIAVCVCVCVCSLRCEGTISTRMTRLEHATSTCPRSQRLEKQVRQQWRVKSVMHNSHHIFFHSSPHHFSLSSQIHFNFCCTSRFAFIFLSLLFFFCRFLANIWPGLGQRVWITSRVFRPTRWVRLPEHGRGKWKWLASRCALSTILCDRSLMHTRVCLCVCLFVCLCLCLCVCMCVSVWFLFSRFHLSDWGSISSSFFKMAIHSCFTQPFCV